jgi:hypothetical protein
MVQEGKVKSKKKIGERAATILTEASVDPNDRPQVMAKIDEDHNIKADKPKVEEKTGIEGTKWLEMLTGMWTSVPSFTTSNKSMEPFMQLMKLQQQQGTNMYRIWIDQLRKMGEAGRSGDAKKVWETCMESNKEICNAYQESLKEQTKEHYELWRGLISHLPGIAGHTSM